MIAASAVWWVQPLVMSLGIAISLSATRATIQNNRRIARVKATLDLIEATESREDYQTLYKNFKRFRTDADVQSGILAARSDEDRAARILCWDFLNHYELVAIGIGKAFWTRHFTNAG
jgi:hypothetical protein